MLKRLSSTALALAALTLGAPAASAQWATGSDPGLTAFSSTVSTDAAGAHPDVNISFTFNAPMFDFAYGAPRQTVVDLPVGLLGDPKATARCLRHDFLRDSCGADTVVGSASVNMLGFSIQTNPVYNLQPTPQEPARIGFQAAGQKTEIPIAVRSDGDFGLRSPATMPAPGFVHAVDLTLWGVPADHGTPGPRRGFMTNPTRCGAGELTTGIAVDLWNAPGQDLRYSAARSRPTGCEAVPFEPAITVTPETTQADAPSGYDVTVALPVDDDPDTPVTSHIRKAVVTLPEGVAMSPSAAGRLDGCTPAQIKLGSNETETCSPESRVGTVEIDSPPLPGLIKGNAYLAEPTDEHPYRIYTVAKGYGLTVKLVGDVLPDPETGRLTTVFDDLPETPVRSFTLKLKGGPTAALTNPPTCGTKAVTTEITPWSGGAPKSPGTSVTYGGCEPARAPGFSAGMESAQAGASSAFALNVSRDDRQPAIERISVAMPAGVTANLSGMPVCSPGHAAAGSCPAATRVGSTEVLAGPGGSPFGLGGNVYFTEGYGGAPFGLSIVVPAKAGPFDLGVVNVRAKVQIDPVTAALRVESDPLPQILEGIPLKLRRVGIRIDRPGFMRSGTSCSPAQIGGDVSGLGVAARLQLTGCAGLGFAPKLTAAFNGGRGHVVRKRGFPGLDVTMTSPGTGANLRSASVTLPNGVAANLAGLQHTCTFEQVAARACPEASKVGWATATTPLLDEPLAGPVYVGRSTGSIPRVVVLLNGRIPLTVIGENTVLRSGLIRATFSAPDVPVTRFALSLTAGKHGMLATSRSMCKSPRRAPAALISHSGRRVNRTLKIAATCKSKSKVKRAKLRRR